MYRARVINVQYHLSAPAHLNLIKAQYLEVMVCTHVSKVAYINQSRHCSQQMYIGNEADENMTLPSSEMIVSSSYMQPAMIQSAGVDTAMIVAHCIKVYKLSSLSSKNDLSH